MTLTFGLLYLLAPVLLSVLFLLLTPAIASWYARSRWASQTGAFKLLSGVEIPDEWGRYSTQSAAEFEIIHRPIWDTQTYVDNTTTLLNFFAAAQANVGLGNEVFPLKNSYLVAAIGLFFKTQVFSDLLTADATAYVSAINDIVLISNTGVLNITIGAKAYGPFPLWKLTPGAGMWGVMAGGSGTPNGAIPPIANYGQLGIPSPEAMYKLAIPLVIPMNTATTLSMTWAAAVNTLGNNALCLCLEGKEARPLQ